MKSYEEFAQENWASFGDEKGETLGFLRDAIKVLQHYAENTRLDEDEASAVVFDKYLDEAKSTLRTSIKTFPEQEKRIKKFFADKNVNISEWD